MTGDATPYGDEDASDLVDYSDEAYQQWEAARAEGRAPGHDRAGGGGSGTGGGGGGGDHGDHVGGGGGRTRGSGGGGGDSGRLPKAMRVRCNFEWAGEQRGPRTSRLEGLELGEYLAAVERAKTARGKASAARPSASYRATGWTAQLRQLEATRAGRAALAREGFDASARTRRRWRAGSGGASKQRRSQIAAAYDDVRMRPVREAVARSAAAKKDATEMLDDALTEAYGVEIRLFDIESMEFLND